MEIFTGFGTALHIVFPLRTQPVIAFQQRWAVPVDLGIELGVTGINFLEKSLTNRNATLPLTSLY